MTRKKDNAEQQSWKEDVKQLLLEDQDLLKMLVEQTVQQLLEAEMEEALQAGKGERTTERLGYRSGYYNRTLITRVGKSALRCRKTGKGAYAPRCSKIPAK